MARPHRGRLIGHNPECTLFKPAGVPSKELRTTTIGLDELETMRLVDGEQMKQIEAAEQMGISQSTIARLLASGRKKTALALAHGDAIQLLRGEAPLNFNELPGATDSFFGGQGRGNKRCGRGGGNGRGR